jgi:uncharacterized coiled-coil protein SlyX
MRDIRGDLQDRASLLEEQVSAQEAKFEKVLEQIRAEHESRVKDLRAQLDAVTKLLELEHRRLGDVPQEQATSLQAAPQAVDQQQAMHEVPQGRHHPTSQPPHRFADFLVSKLNEIGAMSRDDLRRLSLQEGYFVDAESANRGIHETLLNVVKVGLVRQLPNGNLAPATALDTIGLRRAV